MLIYARTMQSTSFWSIYEHADNMVVYLDPCSHMPIFK
jgi:hypothetical protein